MSPSATALFIIQAGNVPRPVADHGECLFGQGRYNQFADTSGRQNLAGLGINYLWQEGIFKDVHAAFILAFSGDTRPDNLRKSVIVSGTDTETSLNLKTHGF